MILTADEEVIEEHKRAQCWRIPLARIVWAVAARCYISCSIRVDVRVPLRRIAGWILSGLVDRITGAVKKQRLFCGGTGVVNPASETVRSVMPFAALFGRIEQHFFSILNPTGGKVCRVRTSNHVGINVGIGVGMPRPVVARYREPDVGGDVDIAAQTLRMLQSSPLSK